MKSAWRLWAVGVALGLVLGLGALALKRMGASEFDSGMGVDDTDDDPQFTAKSAPRTRVILRTKIGAGAGTGAGAGFTWELR